MLGLCTSVLHFRTSFRTTEVDYRLAAAIAPRAKKMGRLKDQCTVSKKVFQGPMIKSQSFFLFGNRKFETHAICWKISIEAMYIQECGGCSQPCHQRGTCHGCSSDIPSTFIRFPFVLCYIRQLPIIFPKKHIRHPIIDQPP